MRPGALASKYPSSDLKSLCPFFQKLNTIYYDMLAASKLLSQMALVIKVDFSLVLRGKHRIIRIIVLVGAFWYIKKETHIDILWEAGIEGDGYWLQLPRILYLIALRFWQGKRGLINIRGNAIRIR